MYFENKALQFHNVLFLMNEWVGGMSHLTKYLEAKCRGGGVLGRGRGNIVDSRIFSIVTSQLIFHNNKTG